MPVSYQGSEEVIGKVIIISPMFARRFRLRHGRFENQQPHGEGSATLLLLLPVSLHLFIVYGFWASCDGTEIPHDHKSTIAPEILSFTYIGMVQSFIWSISSTRHHSNQSPSER